MQNIFQNFQQRVKNHANNKISENNASIRGTDSIRQTTVAGYRGMGAYQRVKYSTTPDSNGYIIGSSSSGSPQ